MTLGPSSIFSIAFILLLTGCAFGEVTGTGGAGRGASGDGSDVPTSNGGTSGSGDTSQSPADENAPVDYEALFDAPADPTTTDDLVTGIWAGTTYYGEVRLKITASKITIAIKCGTSPAEGMDVGSVVSANKMRVLASKSVGSQGYCGLKVTPVEIPRCTSDVYYDCFDVTGTTLRFAGTTLFTGGGSSSEKYTKLSD